jgi:hypothetical protein
MWRSMLQVAAATAVFGLVHSLLASRPAERAARPDNLTSRGASGRTKSRRMSRSSWMASPLERKTLRQGDAVHVKTVRTADREMAKTVASNRLVLPRVQGVNNLLSL